MRVLIAPDKFAGTLSATEAARAIAEGWADHAPGDVIRLAPLADGGPGFASVLHESLGGDLIAATVRGPLGEPTPVTILRHERTAYIESAQACGLQLVAPVDRRPSESSSHGVGEALLAAIESGAERIVVGLGGSATNDGGAGLLGALGATVEGGVLDGGAEGLAEVRSVELKAAHDRVRDVELVLATDVDSVLLGMFGATKTYGPQKGVVEEDIPRLDGLLDGFVVAACGSTPAERRIADAPGAGAAGGLGFALLLLGAGRVSGLELVAEAAGIARLACESDVVVTGEGAYDFSSRRGKVVYGVAQIAGEALRPCVVLAGQVLVGSREMRAMGIEAAYSMVELVGESAALGDPATSLRTLAARVARTWSR